jgi:uncharacterized protein (TIGR02145 family)
VHEIILSEGWNSLSSYLTPDIEDIESLLAPIADELIILQNATEVWFPQGNLNTINTWESGAAFRIKVSEAVNLQITGTEISDKAVSLNVGWNLFPVLSKEGVDVEDLFGEISDDVIILKKAVGLGIYWPQYDINTIGTLLPGEAFFIKMQNAADIVFPSDDVPLACGVSSIEDVDGNSYQVVEINGRCWMAENLKTTKFRNGQDIVNATDNQQWLDNTSGAYSWYNNDVSWKDLYGALYNFAAVKNIHALCPEDWYVPSQQEYTDLKFFMTNDPQIPAASRAKSCRQVNSPLGGECATTEHPRWDENASHRGVDSHGFSALPGGERSNSGQFLKLGQSGYWWSSSVSEQFPTSSWYMNLDYNNSTIDVSFAISRLGQSVRCVKDTATNASVPAVETSMVVEISAFTAMIGGDVEADGGSPVTHKGVVWSTAAGIDVDSNEGIFYAVADTGVFNYELTSLTPQTTYYVRAFAANNTGIAYGEELSFTTSEGGGTFTCGDFLVDSRDGQTYSTVQIGNQCWMAENLNAGTRIDASEESADNGIIEKYCYQDSEDNCDIYGGLYKWDELMGYTADEGVQGICPEGWHVPSDAEWCAMEQEVDQEIECDAIAWRGVDGGGHLKETGTTHWLAPNLGATNSSGFSALPGGFLIGANANSLQYQGAWWSSTTEGESFAFARQLSYGFQTVYRTYSSRSLFGYSVRCVKDTE